MTALDAFQRLEAQGIWRESDQAQRRDVLIAFGDATLTISANAETPLSHWSLAAIHRLNPGLRPALFAPGQDSAETLEIADDLMIDAIEKVRKAVRRQGRRRGGMRLWVGLGLTLALGAIAVLWMPPALHRYAASIVPPSARLELGQAVLAELRATGGASCNRPGTARILDRALNRLNPGFPGKIVVAPNVWPSRVLPGGMMVMDQQIIEGFDSADAMAGFVLADLQRLTASDPLQDMLSQMGLGATVSLLTTGQISSVKLRSHAQELLNAPPAPVDPDKHLEAFRLARVSTGPYAAAIRADQPQTAQFLADNNPTPANLAEPVLLDNDWVKLQAICD